MATVAVPAGPTDIEALEDVLQAAFFDDPVMSWILPNDGDRDRRLARLFRVLLRFHYLPRRTVWTTSDQAGAALWAAPGHWKVSNAEMLRAMPSLLRALGRRAATAVSFLNRVDEHHPEEPHWYLGVLGTDPPRQGHGIGSALMQPVLERCDREGLPAYLESSKESNIAFYGRHGFEVTGEIRPVSGGPVLYPMWRAAQ